ncbi:hypothetical protein D3C73_1305770 [compost metagenome]
MPVAESLGRGESFIEGALTGLAGLGSSVASAITGTIGTIGTKMTSVGSWINSDSATSSTPVAAPLTPWYPADNSPETLQARADAATAQSKAEFPGADPRLNEYTPETTLSDRSTYWLNWEKENGRL